MVNADEMVGGALLVSGGGHGTELLSVLVLNTPVRVLYRISRVSFHTDIAVFFFQLNLPIFAKLVQL